MSGLSYKGKFHPINREKYRGDVTTITYRSLWERKVMKTLDENPDVIEWASEEIVIPYIKVLKSNNKFSFVELKPITGRKHQLRKQLFNIGHPVVGDEKYSFKNEKNSKNLLLQNCHCSLL